VNEVSIIVDMRVERDWLWKTAIPQLRHWCAGQCVKFLVIDLPWDLHHSAHHQSSSSAVAVACEKSLRLTELDRCKKQSIGPDFVVCIYFVVHTFMKKICIVQKKQKIGVIKLNKQISLQKAPWLAVLQGNKLSPVPWCLQCG